MLYGVISPWIRKFAKISSRLTSLVICSECRSAAFTVRYEPEVMFNLYSEYRGTVYTAIRNKWENWYTLEFNEGHSKQLYVNQRKKLISEFLISEGFKQIESILDVGGDSGQYIPDFKNLKQKIVFDISNKNLISGVTRVNSLEEVSYVDLVVYAHTLEHVNDPIFEVQKLLRYTNNLYIEVPFGVPTPSKARRSRLIQMIALIASISPQIWSTISRPSSGRKINSKILRQSEHLNFFSPYYFDVIAQKLNLEVRKQVCEVIGPDLSRADVIQVLFKKK